MPDSPTSYNGQCFNQHLPTLDLLRALAIIMVMLFHFAGSFLLPKDSYVVRFFLWGKHGVDLFFVLSGFLIGGQIIENTFRKSFSFKIFYFKRFLRIFPAYYGSIFLYALLFYFLSGGNLFDNAGTMNDIFIHLAYTQNYFDPKMYGGIYWSLAVEEQFYIIIPVLLFFIAKHNHRILIPAFLMIIFTFIIVTYFLYDSSDKWWYFFMDHNVRGFSSLVGGVITSYCWIQYREKLKNMHFLFKIFLLMVSLSMLFLSYSNNFEFSWYGSLWQFIPTAIGFSGLILYLAIRPISFPFQQLIKKITKISYTMYLYHVLIAIFFIKLLKAKGIFYNYDFSSLSVFLIIFSIYFLLVCILCQIIYYLIEKPTVRIRELSLKKWSALKSRSLRF